jgi:hypothetical protein
MDFSSFLMVFVRPFAVPSPAFWVKAGLRQQVQ